MDAAVAGALAVAALAGTAVGIERERSGHTIGPQARFAGVRTFFLIGGLGGVCGWLVTAQLVTLAAVLLGGAALLIVSAYVLVARHGGEAVDGTTEMAALMTLALGVVAGLGQPLLTSAATSIILLVLAEKTRIHQAIQRMSDLEVASALRFSVLALVVLPLLPAGPFGPGDAIRPRAMWMVVLVFSAVNFGAFIAIRTLGPRHGYGASGLLGGLISSTVVTLQFSRRSRHAPALGGALALGVLSACVMLILRLEFLTLILNPPIARQLVAYLGPTLLLGIGMLVVLYRRYPDVAAGDGQHDLHNPLGLRSSLLMAAGFQAAILILGAVQTWLGSVGVIASAAALGLTDMDALTYAMSQLGKQPDLVELAAKSIAIGLIANTLLKAGVAAVLGRGHYRREVLAGLGLLLLGSVAGMWLVGMG